MEKHDIADALVALRIATRRACTNKSENRIKGTLSLESKILFLLKDGPMTPNNLVDVLLMKKSNLACLCKSMQERGLIERHKTDGRREVAFAITDKGLETIESKLSETEKRFRKFLADGKEYEDATETLNAATRLLSFFDE